MGTEATYIELKTVALQEFSDVIVSASILKGPLQVAESLRIYLIDNSFLEVWISGNKYSYHWQKIDGKVYRHDNAPHKKHKHIKTFPKHFHDGSEGNVKESRISDNPSNAIREILRFIRVKL